jgi:hypothetical protein
MPREPELLRGGEVNFRPFRHKEVPPEAWQSGAWKPRGKRPPNGVSGWLILLILAALALWWLNSCGHREKLVTVKLSNGQVLHLTPEQAEDLYIRGADFPWDFTKQKNTPEPKLPSPASAPPLK